MPAPRSDLPAFLQANPQMKAADVARQLGVTVGTVYQCRAELKRRGLALPDQRRRTAELGGANTAEAALTIGDATMRFFKAEAQRRGESADGLMARLLDVIAADRMVAAVLDDAP